MIGCLNQELFLARLEHSKTLQLLLHRQTGGHQYQCARYHQSRCRRNHHDWIRCAYSLCTFHSYVWPQSQQTVSSVCTLIMILHWSKSLLNWSVEMLRLRQGSGLVMDWNHPQTCLLAWLPCHKDVGCANRNSGPRTSSPNHLFLPHTCCRIWKPTLTALSWAYPTRLITDFLAGFTDGVVMVFDERLEDDGCIVRTYADDTSWVQNVRWILLCAGSSSLLGAFYGFYFLHVFNNFNFSSYLLVSTVKSNHWTCLIIVT